jgi:hypothetical protein
VVVHNHGKAQMGPNAATTRTSLVLHSLRPAEKREVSMWSLVAGLLGAVGIIIVAIRVRRRAGTRKPIDVGAVSDGWISQQRGSPSDSTDS